MFLVGTFIKYLIVKWALRFLLLCYIKITKYNIIILKVFDKIFFYTEDKDKNKYNNIIYNNDKFILIMNNI